MSSEHPQGKPEVKGRLHRNVLRERVNFSSYKFDSTQTIDSHIDNLWKLASNCEFGGQAECRIIDKILSDHPKVTDNVLEILDQEQNVTLQRVLDVIKAEEKIDEDLLEEEGIMTHQKFVARDEVDSIVNSALTDKKSLNEVETLISHQFHCTLSNDDRKYIEETYTETLIELWLDETSENAMNTMNNSLEHIEELRNIKTWQDCFGFGLSSFRSSYNNLMIDLLKQSQYIKTQEKKTVLKFKSTFFAFLMLKSTYLQSEINFFNSLIKTMKSTKHIQQLCISLKLIDFLETKEDETTSFRKLLTDIINCHVLKDTGHLLTATQAIVEHDRYFFINCVKNSIMAYLKPVEIAEVQLDGRKLIEVIGEHIVTGQVLDEIEKTRGFSEIEEIRFVNAGVIHIDRDLKSKVWHGKNIVVFAETIIISMDKEITWNLSGQDASNEELNSAGTSCEGIGLNGADGASGESGGNVLLICDEVENASCLTIVSNGGKGGKGQAGGNGSNGKDGDYMSEIEFKKNFPPVSKVFDKNKRQNLEITTLSVMDNILSAKFSVLGKLIPVSIDDFNNILVESSINLKDIYFETKTKTGCEILFSFHSAQEKLFAFCQSFLFHKGADGEPGKEAGKGGVGGKGGFSGEVRVVVNELSKSKEAGIVIHTNKGEDGQHGESGVMGKPGECGPDCAYIDSTKPKLPILNKVHFPKYFISEKFDTQRLKVEYHPKEGPERIYCPHNGQFAEITKIKKDKFIHRICNLSNTSSQKELANSQFNVQVIRKKTISLKCIMERYEHKSELTGYKKLHGIENDIKRIYEDISKEEILSEEQVSKQTRITRKIEFSPDNRQRISFTSVSEITTNTENLYTGKPTEASCSTMTDFSNWNSLIYAKLDLQQLQLFLKSAGLNNLNSLQAIYLSKDESTEKVPLLLRNKYVLAVLDHLEQTFPLQPIITHSSTCTQKVLGAVECTLSTSNQQNFSEVESYLCSDSTDKRLSIIRKLTESATDGNFFFNIFNLYLDDYTKFDDCEKFLSDKALEVYKKVYNNFKQNKCKSVQTKLIPLLNYSTRNQDMYNTVVKALNEPNIRFKIELENHIRRNPLLNFFYEKSVEEVNRPFVWKSILMSKEILTSKLVQGFKTAIHLKGPSSVFFREVVARLFKTNILVYTIGEHNNEMMLVHNHNPSADEVVQILIRDNQCFTLKTNEGLSEIIRAHEGKGQMCNKLALHVDLIKGQEAYIEEFDRFIFEKPFLHDDYNGISKTAEIRMKISHMLMEDENIKSIASSFKSDEELVCSRLQMLKHEYVGYQSFLYFIALHLKTEGIKISVKELCCVVNFILKSITDSSSKTLMVSWIISAYHQTDWIIELILLKLELYFKIPLKNEVKDTWRRYLRQSNREASVLFFDKVGLDDSLLKIEDAEEVLQLMSQVPNYLVGLSQLSLDEWKYYLKDIFWINQMNNTGNWSEEELKIASFYLSRMENSFGNEICTKFIEVVKSQSVSIRSQSDKWEVLNTLKLLTSQEIVCLDKLLQNLSQASVNDWKDIAGRESLTYNERSLSQLRELIKTSSNTSTLILSTIDEVVKSVENVGIILSFLKDNMKKESILKKWLSNLLAIFDGRLLPLFDKSDFLQTTLSINNEMTLHFQEMQKYIHKMNQDHKVLLQTPTVFFQCHLNEIFLATICAFIHVMFKKSLRNTQLLAIAIFLRTSENVLGQVSTGEGKTFIIVAVAIMKALAGCKVDIITSSHVLAKRDARNHERLCKMFNIEVGHNCSENIEERKNTYSKCHIVYGELSYFQRDFLLDRVYNNNILGDRTYETIIVDEVDSMLLDKANNVLYLSHDIPGVDKLEPLFVFIWKYLHVPSSANDNKLNVDDLKGKIIGEIYNAIKIEDIRNLDLRLERSVFQTWTHLKNKGVIDSFGNVLFDKFDEAKIDEAVKGCDHEDGIKYLLKKILTREKEFEIPNYLKTFVVDHIDKWIDSAVSAINLKNNVDYVVDVDRNESSLDRTPNIIILDRDTGTDLTNSQWDQGLHQFLQLKHGCRLSPLTFKAVFISNVSYLRQYKTLFGLTGTLGSKTDRDLLKKVYKVEFVTIPTAKPKQFYEEPPILCKSTDDWSTKIVERVYEITNSRSALIVCHSLSDVFTLKKSFEIFSSTRNVPMRQIQTYTRDYEEFNVNSLEVGKVIISTNLAGRGTDIQLSEKLIDNGGLHVCLSFLPSNSRVEEQAFGRSARNGQPGSGQMIFKSYGQNYISKVIDLKKERDINEIFRISDVNKYYKTKVKPEEELFSTFLKVYEPLRESNYSLEIKSILQMACLDLWAFWLEKNSNSLVPLSINDLIERISQLWVDDVDTWTRQIQDPFQLIKLGLFYIKKDNVKAIKIFDHVISSEPDFSEAAYYFRACAKTLKDEITQNKQDYQDLVEDLKTVKKKLKNRIECSLKSAQFIEYLKDYNSRNIIQIDSFKNQQLIVSKTYEVFLSSINNIIGQPVNPEILSVVKLNCRPNIEHDILSSILFNDLIENDIIRLSIKDNVTERDLNFATDYGASPKILKNILGNLPIEQGPLVDSFEKLVLNKLKENCLLPSREMFWKELLSNGILVNEEKHVIVNLNQLGQIDPSCAKQIKKAAIDQNCNLTCAKNKVSLYLPEELGQLEDNIEDRYALFPKDVLKTMLGQTKFTFLKRENIFLFNKQANFSDLMKTIELSHFDCITKEDFSRIGMSCSTASLVIENLIQEKIIGLKNNCNPPQYKLLVNFEGIDYLELKLHKAYLPDVKSLLSYCFAFRLALQKLQHVEPHCKGDYSRLAIPLLCNLYKSFWFDLQEQEIVEQNININKIRSGKLQATYFTLANRESFEKIFSTIYDKEKSVYIVDGLIKQGWLKKTTLSELNKLDKSDIIRFLTPGNGSTYCINYKCGPKKELQLGKHNELSGDLKCDSETIELILLYHLNLSRNVKLIEDILKSRAGSIHEVSTPCLSLTSLEEVMTECRIPTSEINLFNMNGFDQIINLEEKKYTKMMKISCFCISMLALAEISVGLAVQLTYFPIGPYLLTQGIDDFIYISSCVFSGHFTWKGYLTHKVISLVTAALSCYSALKSTFAKKSAGMSVETMKEQAVGVFSKIKSSVKYLFKSEVSSQIPQKQVYNQVLKRLIIHTGEGIAHGISFHALEYGIQSQIEFLGESLTDLVFSDIDKTVIDHPSFQSVTEMYKQIGGKKAKTIIDSHLCTISHGYKAKLQQNFESIDLRLVNTLIERTVSKAFTRKSGVDKAIAIYNAIQNICAVLKKASTHFKEITSLVNNILNDVQQELQIELKKPKEKLTRQTFQGNELTQFQSEVLRDMQNVLKEIFSVHIKNNVISPVLQFVGACVEKRVAMMISQTRSFLTDSEKFNLKVNGTTEIRKKTKTKGKTKRPGFFSSDFDEITREVLKTRKNKMALSYMLSQNVPMDVYCLELCCKALTVASKQEGVRLPPLRIEMETNDVKNVFCIGDTRDDSPTLHITPDADLSSNVKNNKIIVTDLFNSLSKAFLEHNPEYNGFTAAFLQELVVKAIHNFCDRQNCESTANDGDHAAEKEWIFTDASSNVNQINAECEKTNPYQHSKCEGGWIFSPRVDVDLRVKGKLINIHKHVIKGFEMAVLKVNTHIHRIQNCLRSFNLVIGDFEATKHQLAPPPYDMSELFHCYTVQYELILPVILKDVKKSVDFNILLRLENEKPKNKLRHKSPFGPHILYEINPLNDAKFLDKGLKGHILLNFDCVDINYSLSDCRVAGELIVSSALQNPVAPRETERRNSVVKDPVTKLFETENKMSRANEKTETKQEVGQDIVETENKMSRADFKTETKQEVGQDIVETENKMSRADLKTETKQEVGQDIVETENKMSRADLKTETNQEVGQDIVETENKMSRADLKTETKQEVGQDIVETENKMSRADLKTELLQEVGQDIGTYKECDAIIVGDSLFKYIHEYIKLPNCDFGIFPYMKINQFSEKVMSYLANYKEVKCVVLFFGNDIVKTNILEQEIATCIFNVIKNIQLNIKDVKVILCSLVFAKQNANRYNDRINGVNRILEDYCTRENVVRVDTNRIICPQDLGKDGIHLNRSGYHKLGRHISERCKEIIYMN